MSTNIIGKSLFGRYQVRSFIESGGMAEVYQVWDQQRQQVLALKILHGELAEDPALKKRFIREARALQKLAHPNIVRFFDFHEAEGTFYLFEEFIDGSSLKQILSEHKGQPMPVREAAIYLRSLTAALGFAHINGVVHCDIKPGNILIDQGGMIYLTDFGIARRSDSTATSFGSAGTPSYMAPEQIRGGRVFPTTDVYALGVLAFELLTGKRPFLGDEPGTEKGGESKAERVCYAHLNLAPPDPRSINPALPEALSAVLLKALEKDPVLRYLDMQEFFQAFCDAAAIPPEEIPDRLHSATFTAGRLQPIVFKEQPPRPSKPAWWRQKAVWIIAAGSLIVIFFIFAALIGILALKLPWISFQPSHTRVALKASQAVTGMPTRAPTVDPTIPGGQSSGIQISVPTATGTARPKPTLTVTSIDTEAYFPFPDCPATHLHIGDWSIVNPKGSPNFVRSSSDNHPSDNIIGSAQPGEMIHIAGGPECVNHWMMWQVNTSSGLDGWTAETNGDQFYILPLKTTESCSGALPSHLRAGIKAQITLYPPVSSRLRADPGKSGARVGSLDPGKAVEVLDGPECKDNIAWWKVQSENPNLTGWAAEGDAGSYYLIPSDFLDGNPAVEGATPTAEAASTPTS
jgi:serine/threonine protein kinase